MHLIATFAFLVRLTLTNNVYEPLTFVIDLDAKPDDVFAEPAIELIDYIQDFAESFYNEVPLVVRKLFELICESNKLLELIFQNTLVLYKELTNVDLHKIVALQFLVELSNVRDSVLMLYGYKENSFSARNFDFAHKPVAYRLRKCTFIANLVRNGKPAGTAIMIMPIIGFYTFGSNKFSLYVSTDRNPISLADVARDIVSGHVQSLSTTMRTAALDYGAVSGDLIVYLNKAKTGVISYFSFMSPECGLIITKLQNNNTLEFLYPREKDWFLVQTNYDRSINDPLGREFAEVTLYDYCESTSEMIHEGRQLKMP
ncbi:hypothetical protein ACOME3_010175 [Neoechinorhynchus agilis]